MWNLRAIETPDQRWSCRFGLTEYDSPPHVTQAIEHLRALRIELGPTIIYLHPLDGPAQPLAK
jgi:hypothetical protein